MSADFHVSLLSCMVRDDNVLLKAVIFIFFAIIHYKMVFGDSDGKEPTCNVGDLGWIPGLRRSPGEGKGYSFQYPGLENTMDCIDRKRRTRLSDFHFSL